MSYLDKIAACNRPTRQRLSPWSIGGQSVGWVAADVARVMREMAAIFEPDLGLCADIRGFDERSDALFQVARRLLSVGLAEHWLDEPYPVTPGDMRQALATTDRGSAAPLGLRTFGQHLNGYVRKADGIHMWIARRAYDRKVFPGRLDNLVAGGLPYGLDVAENLRKEAQEEAGMSEALAAQAVPVGGITYNTAARLGFKQDTLYCYDLELPPHWEPNNTDGEVDSFVLMPLAQVAELVSETDEFKLNCNLVVIDFLVRHGHLGPDDPDYINIVTGLHPVLGLPPGEVL